MSVEHTELYQALVKAQSEVRAALKTSKNNFHGYKYASAEEVLSVGRDALNANGLALFAESEVLVQREGMVPVLSARYIVAHVSGITRSLETECPIIEEKGRPLDKATFGARTESLGYALRDLLLIPRSDAPDVSGRDDTRREVSQPAATVQAPKPRTPEELADAFRERIEAAKNEQELSRVNVALKKAHEAGKIPKDTAPWLLTLAASKLGKFREPVDSAIRGAMPPQFEQVNEQTGEVTEDDVPPAWGGKGQATP